MYFYVFSIIFAILVVVGVICILKEIYDIIMMDFADENVIMIINADNENSEILIRKAVNIRQRYFNNMDIIFIDKSGDKSSVMESIAQKYQMMYINGKD